MIIVAVYTPDDGIDKLSDVPLHILVKCLAIALQYISTTQRLAFVASDNSWLIPGDDHRLVALFIPLLSPRAILFDSTGAITIPTGRGHRDRNPDFWHRFHNDFLASGNFDTERVYNFITAKITIYEKL